MLHGTRSQCRPFYKKLAIHYKLLNYEWLLGIITRVEWNLFPSKRFLIVMISCHYVRISSVQNIFDFALCLLPSAGGNILVCEILWKHVNVVHFFLNCGRILRSIGQIRSTSFGNCIWCDRLQDCGSVMPNECSDVINRNKIRRERK